MVHSSRRKRANDRHAQDRMQLDQRAKTEPDVEHVESQHDVKDNKTQLDQQIVAAEITVTPKTWAAVAVRRSCDLQMSVALTSSRC